MTCVQKTIIPSSRSGAGATLSSLAVVREKILVASEGVVATPLIQMERERERERHGNPLPAFPPPGGTQAKVRYGPSSGMFACSCFPSRSYGYRGLVVQQATQTLLAVKKKKKTSPHHAFLSIYLLSQKTW